MRSRPAYRAAALVAAAQLAAAANTTDSTCYLRLVHEFSAQTGQVSLVHGSDVLTTTGLHGVSGYGQTDCSDASALFLTTGGQPISGGAVALPQPSQAGTSYFTILAGTGVGGSIFTSVFPDVGSALPDHYYSISVSGVRFLNAWPGSPAGVAVYGVTKDCYSCARQLLFTVPFGGSNAMDANWLDWYHPTTEYGVSLEVVPVNPAQAPAAILPSTGVGAGEDDGPTSRSSGNGYAGDLLTDEHGVYTVVIHDGPSIEWSVTTDVPGQNQWLALLYAFLALVGLGVVYHALAYGIAQAAAGTAWGKAVADGVSARASSKKRDSDVTLVRFLGLDMKIAKAVRAQQEAQGGSGGSKGQGDDLREGLLVEEGGATATASTGSLSSKPAAALSSGRFQSLDTLRGLSLIIMAFVNYGAGDYSMLDHSAWNGLHLADLVFPWFVWMSGVSMAISYDSQRKRGASRADLAYKISSRAAKLFALGLFMNNGAVLAQWRILGVLQYFAVSNLIVGLVEALLHPTNTPAGADGKGQGQSTEGRSVLHLHVDVLAKDIGLYWVQWAVMLALLAVYLIVQGYLPLPAGCPTGYIGPGGLADNGKYYGLGCTGGAHRVVDYMIFGANHIYHGIASDGTPTSAATCAAPYACDVHDPEGALGWITAAWMVWLGLQCGRVLVHYKQAGMVEGQAGVDTAKLVRPYLVRLVTWGSALCLLGGALCGFSKEGGALPINKNLWSPSFVFILSGLGFLWIALLWTLIDHKRWWSGSPLRYVGMNSIAFYILHETYSNNFPMSTFTQYPGWGSPYGASWYSHSEALGSNVAGVLSWVMLMRYLYLKGTFINL